MRVQRVVPQADSEVSWKLLDEDHLPVPPVESFLSHLADQGRSPNTVCAYAFDLKDYFAYLTSRGLDWAQLRYDELAGFKPWLRLPPAARAGQIAVLPSVESACTESTINRKLAAVTSFYEFHARHGVTMASVIRSAARPVGTTRSTLPGLRRFKFWPTTISSLRPRRGR